MALNFSIPTAASPLTQGPVVAVPWYAFFTNVYRILAGVGSTLGSLGTYAFISADQITKSIAADVNLNNTGAYFDGPSVAQGTTGVWYASGTVTVGDTTSAATFFAQLWDGATVIASGSTWVGGGVPGVIPLSGFISNPTGNIRISVRDVTTTHGLILANYTGKGADSTLTAFRIG